MKTLSTTRVLFGICCALIFLFCISALTGCSVPAITAEFPVVEGQTLPGTLISIPLAGLPLVPGLSCNLPDEEDFNQIVADSLGAFLSRFVVVESAELNAMTLAVTKDSPGNFGHITQVEINLFLIDVGGLRLDTIPLGNAEALNGFGDTLQLTVNPPADLAALVRTDADCGAVSIAVSGRSSSKDIVFDVRVRLKIKARIKLC